MIHPAVLYKSLITTSAADLYRLRYSVAGRTLTYDARGNVVEEEYFDENGHATRFNDGLAKITKTYNARRELFRQARFDEQGRPIPDWQDITF